MARGGAVAAHLGFFYGLVRQTEWRRLTPARPRSRHHPRGEARDTKLRATLAHDPDLQMAHDMISTESATWEVPLGIGVGEAWPGIEKLANILGIEWLDSHPETGVGDPNAHPFVDSSETTSH